MQDKTWLKRHWVAVASVGVAAVVVVAFALSAAYAQSKKDTSDDANGWLGVYIQNIDRDLADSEKLPSTDGVMVNGVVEGSPAEDAGLKEGDVILKYDGKDATTVRRLTRMIDDTAPKTKVNLVILRDGKQQTIPVEIGEEKDSDWSWSGTPGSDYSFNFRAPRAPRAPQTPRSFETPDVPDAPDSPDAPDTPRPPRAYAFSLGQLSTSHIGVSLYDMSDQLAEHFGLKDGGALINEVVKDGPAAKAGLQAGDIILEVDHKPVHDVDGVRRAIAKKEDGEKATIMVARGVNEMKTVDVTVQSDDTWSGIGAPLRFHSRSDNAGMQELRNNLRDAMRGSGDDWRQQFEEQMRDLREQLRQLREDLKDRR